MDEHPCRAASEAHAMAAWMASMVLVVVAPVASGGHGAELAGRVGMEQEVEAARYGLETPCSATVESVAALEFQAQDLEAVVVGLEAPLWVL